MNLLAARERSHQITVGDRRVGDLVIRDRPRREQCCPDGGRLTLERQLADVWEGLHAAGAAACPMCGGRMDADDDAGRCEDCGTILT